nr:hypothetical protein GCM10023233_30600 [Brevibacterium otitidis]
MIGQLLSDEVAASLGKFFFGGAGPSHATATRCFTACGLSDEDPYDVATGTPNKEHRALLMCRTARRRPGDVAARHWIAEALQGTSTACQRPVAER